MANSPSNPLPNLFYLLLKEVQYKCHTEWLRTEFTSSVTAHSTTDRRKPAAKQR